MTGDTDELSTLRLKLKEALACIEVMKNEQPSVLIAPAASTDEQEHLIAQLQLERTHLEKQLEDVRQLNRELGETMRAAREQIAKDEAALVAHHELINRLSITLNAVSRTLGAAGDGKPVRHTDWAGAAKEARAFAVSTLELSGLPVLT